MRREMVGRHVEEALDGLGVQVEQQQAVGAGQRDEVGNQLGRDRLPRLRLAFLARVSVVRNHRGHPPGGGPAQRVEDDEQLHQVLVDGRARGLDHEHVVTAHRVLYLDVDLPVGEMTEPGIRELDVEDLGNPPRQDRVGPA